MILHFTASGQTPPLEEKREEIGEVVARLLHDASFLTEEKSRQLILLLPDDTDKGKVGAFCRELRALGIDLVLSETAEKEKTRTRIPLSAFLISLIAVAVAVAILAAGITAMVCTDFFSRYRKLGTAESDERYGDKIALVDEIFRKYSLYDTNGELLLDEMLKAYAAATGDDYAAYYTDEEYRAISDDNNARMVGIGVSVTESADHVGIRIVDVVKGSPAESAGLLPGDLITAVGERENVRFVSELGYDLAVASIRGEAGTEACFTVLRGAEEIPMRVTRAEIETVSAEGMVSETDPSVGIVRVSRFNLRTPEQFEKSMDALIAAGCTDFVFDLRNNPGGDLRSVIAMVAFFVNENDVVLSTVAKNGDTKYYKAVPTTYSGDYAPCSIRAEQIGKYRSYGKTVLVNGNSASAAELFTAALADYELATVVGENTFGKGIIQNLYSLSNWGYSGVVKLTTGYYCPPSGVNYHGKGIAPAVAVAPDAAIAGKNPSLLSEAEDNQLQAAIAVLQTD